VDDEPEIKIIDVFVCKLRKKMEIFGVKIETIWGRGYYMTPEMKAKAAAMMTAPITSAAA
jgi:two-component system cell cycle response regulator CtrA